ncbi:TonB-dependent receptor [Bacteriovorax sp. PP10]|uniref:TonB-dependent receptor n=1 Tax=Bacteriovorax antarcticus TaxID=3088717 RepID=A0ABU5VU50_9BACT|nr:TonB-dependent receptor [Bacteriovorax sp. PP10]MEA9356586.1 TonB-dependent receptor [Bacteriovorax sp. PP10]
MLEKNLTHLALIALTLTTHSIAHADDSTIIVTADRIKSSLDKSPSDIKVFETEEISKATSIADLLSTQSDIKVAQSGPLGANTSLFLRGSDSSHTLVIIDGIIMNDPSNPNRQFDLGRLSLNNVERIEILKGSQGLLYGSNAIGGVILITSKKGQNNFSGSALVDYGTFDTFSSAVNVQKKVNNTAMSFGIDHLKTKGFSAANVNVNPNADDDGQKLTTVSAGLNQGLGEKSEVVLNYRGVFDEADLDKGGGAGQDDPNDSQNSEEHYLKAGYNYNWSEGETQLSLTRSTHHRTLRVLPDTANPASSAVTSKGDINAVAINHTQYTTDRLTQNINLDYQHEEDQLKNSNENTSLFLYNRYEVDTNIYNLGVRVDSNQSFGEHLTYKAAYLHNFDPALLKMSYSTGFRAPSLNQLYDPTYGNKNLTPEESQSAEVGFEIPFVIHVNTATLFYTEIDNRLSYDPVTFVNQNRGRARIIGFENVFDTTLSPDMNLGIATTWMSARDLTAKQKLARRPNFNAKVIFNYKQEKHAVTVEGDFTGKRPDVDNLGNTVSLGSNIVFNMNYSYNFTEKFSSYAKIRNILNKDYEDIYGYGTGGRSATLGLKYIF